MPSPIEKLKKFFKLEAERGYDNRAVVGGLEKILPSWLAEAKSLGLPEEAIQIVNDGLNLYPSLDPVTREQKLNDILTQVSQKAEQSQPQVAERPVPQTARPLQSQREPTPISRRAKAPTPHSTLPENTNSLGLNAPLTVLTGLVRALQNR